MESGRGERRGESQGNSFTTTCTDPLIYSLQSLSKYPLNAKCVLSTAIRHMDEVLNEVIKNPVLTEFII